MQRAFICFLVGCVWFWAGSLCAAEAAVVSFESLLDEMADVRAIAQFPDPAYICRQFASYDRASVAPDQPGWFANGDSSKYGTESLNIVRTEMHDGKEEWVLLDAEGPGAIVRWWITAKEYKTQFRIYIDGADTPEMEGKIDELVGGDFLVGEPLSAERARGKNLYLPIPYAKSCKITLTEPQVQERLFYQINYRTYAPGTQVESFSMADFKRRAERVQQLQQDLLKSDEVKWSHEPTVVERVKSGDKTGLEKTVTSPHCLSQLSVKIKADDMEQASRSVLVSIAFDGQQTVLCPVGSFFGSGVGVHPYQSWYTSVLQDGTMLSRWCMPFQKDVKVGFINLAPEDVQIEWNWELEPYAWDANTMYFHANWRAERDLKTIPDDGTKDWNYITIRGRGVYAGDSLSITNTIGGWWGEGDEKIFVDGEDFPSHFGTGTEDYYGYAWCTGKFFESPFHYQSHNERGNYGNVTVGRVRLLDGIPFQKDFRFDMEVWNPRSVTVGYAATTYWYAFDGASHDDPSDFFDEVKAKVYKQTPQYFESLGVRLISKSAGTFAVQDMTDEMKGPHQRLTWIGNRQLWWRDGLKPNDAIVLSKNVREASEKMLCVHLTQAPDYGKVQFFFNGEAVGHEIDLYHDSVVNTGLITLGKVHTNFGENLIQVKVVNKNPKSTGYSFGIHLLELR